MRSQVRLAENLVLRDGVVYGIGRVAGKTAWKRSELQGGAALSPGGKPLKSLLKWRDVWLSGLRQEAQKQAVDPDYEAPGRIPTWEQLIEVYQEEARRRFAAAGSPKPTTVTTNVGRLQQVLREMGLALSEPLSSGRPELVEDWVAARVLKEEDQKTARYTAASVLRQVTSVWARWMVEPLRRRGMVLPRALDRWPAVDGAYAPKYQFPAAELVARTLDGARKLEQEEPSTWLAFGLMFHCGMRPGDAGRAEWRWFGDGRELVFEPQKTASRTRGRLARMQISPTLWARLQAARRAVGGEFETVLPGDAAARRAVLDRMNEHMRAWGWAGSKASYELRKLFASAVYMRLGLAHAAQYTGDNATTVQQYYAALDPAQAAPVDVDAVLAAPAPVA